MMMNLFSIFDPASSIGYISINWSALGLGLLFFSFSWWTLPSRGVFLLKTLFKALNKETSLILGVKNKKTLLIFMSLFSLILFNNVLGLLPWVFTSTSHLAITLSLGLPLWVGFYLKGWLTNTSHMLAHLVPQGTPAVLAPFMVLIESISSLIRPLTLAVRLAANMIAGHLLLVLMSGAISLYTPSGALFILLSQTLLLSLELAVAAIQAYVFTILMVLYVSEV